MSPVADRPTITLLFLTGGQVQLEEEDGEVVWESDDDADFREEIPDEFLQPSDHAKILEYLIDCEIIDQTDAADCTIEVESLEADEIDIEDPDEGPELDS